MRNFIIDKEIDLLEGQGSENTQPSDLLKAMNYVETLTESVKNAPTDRSFNIGLFGDWGSGKSSIIKSFKHKIEADYSAQGKSIKVITYDAWKYANDSFRRMFLLQMQQDLGLEGQELMNKFYLNSSEDAHIDTKVNWREVLIGAAVIATVMLAISYCGMSPDNKIAANAIVALGSLLLAIWRGLFKELKVNIQRPHLFAPEQFEECFNEMCKKAYHKDGTPLSYLKWIKGETGVTSLDRLVIVIDNVDRCSSQLAYELLTNIKNFLGSKHHVVFIIPVDEEALKRHFSHAELGKAHDADEFLRKFFNICIRIKNFQRDEMFDYADTLNKRNQLGFNPTTVSLVANEFAHTPRRIIQMFNNLSVELMNLPDEFDKKHQSLVCLLLIVREEYQEFYKLLLNDSQQMFNIDGLETVHSAVKRFLQQNSAVIAPYTDKVNVIERILSNVALDDKLPQMLIKGYEEKAYSQEMLTYLADGQHRMDMMHFVERKLKLAIDRQLWETDVKNTIDRIFALSKAISFTRDENMRLAGFITGKNNFQNIADKQNNLRELIDYAAQTDEQGIPSVAEQLSAYIHGKGETDSAYMDRTEIWYACYKLKAERIKHWGKVTLAAYKKDMKGFKTYDYGEEKSAIIFSDDFIRYILGQIKEHEADAVECIAHIASKISMKPELLAEYVRCMTEVTPAYNINRKNTEDLRKRLKKVNGVLQLCKSCRTKKDEYESLTAFYAKFVHTTVVNNGYNRTVQRGFFLDNLGQPEIMKDIIDFFTYASLISNEAIVHPEIIKTILSSKNHDADFVEAIGQLHAAGYPIEFYKEPLLSIGLFDEPQLALINYLLKKQSKDGSSVATDDEVRAIFERLFTKILDTDGESRDLCMNAIKTLAKDNRCSMVLTSLLVQKDKDWLLSLPGEMMEYAVGVFEAHIEEYKPHQNVMLLLAAKGSLQARQTVASIANAKINDEQQRKNGFEIIHAFTALSSGAAKPLLSSLEFIKENHPKLKDAVDGCVEHLKKIVVEK